MTNGKGPVKKYKARAVAVALWESEVNINGQMRTVMRASVERRYKDADGQWKSSNSFNRNEIPLVQFCLGKAFEAMLEERSAGADPVEEVLVE